MDTIAMFASLCQAETAVSMAASIQAHSLFSMAVIWGKASYQRRHSANYRGFKLARSTFVLSILDVNKV